MSKNDRAESVFVDTNVFLRYLTNDVPKQADEVHQLFLAAKQGTILLVTTAMVVAEIVWTLESYYQLAASDVRDQILAILNTDGLEVENSGMILQAITDHVDLNVDFIDAYCAEWLLSKNLDVVCTFDTQHFNRLPGIVARSPDTV